MRVRVRGRGRGRVRVRVRVGTAHPAASLRRLAPRSEEISSAWEIWGDIGRYREI